MVGVDGELVLAEGTSLGLADVRRGELGCRGRVLGDAGAALASGGAANVGLVRLARLCESIEHDAAEGGLPSASVLFELEDEVAAGVAELAKFARDMVRDAAAATRS